MVRSIDAFGAVRSAATGEDSTGGTTTATVASIAGTGAPRPGAPAGVGARARAWAWAWAAAASGARTTAAGCGAAGRGTSTIWRSVARARDSCHGKAKPGSPCKAPPNFRLSSATWTTTDSRAATASTRRSCRRRRGIRGRGRGRWGDPAGARAPSAPAGPGTAASDPLVIRMRAMAPILADPGRSPAPPRSGTPQARGATRHRGWRTAQARRAHGDRRPP